MIDFAGKSSISNIHYINMVLASQGRNTVSG